MIVLHSVLCVEEQIKFVCFFNKQEKIFFILYYFKFETLIADSGLIMELLSPSQKQHFQIQHLMDRDFHRNMWERKHFLFTSITNRNYKGRSSTSFILFHKSSTMNLYPYLDHGVILKTGLFSQSKLGTNGQPF